ncbi:type II toxin-antitoxin system VapC family toxin, partial [Aphanizomenon sp. 202]|nr:type II toxin-antitoxin system VapC family toxin [Aphanizomenon sp. 202]
MNNYLICVDASFTINLINSKSMDSPFINLWENWQQNSDTIIAPTLFYYEITNALHRMNQANLLTIEETKKSFARCVNLGIVLYGSSQFPQVHEMALTLAKTLKLSAAYDSHYLVQVGVNNMIIKSSENLIRHLQKRCRDVPWNVSTK